MPKTNYFVRVRNCARARARQNKHLPPGEKLSKLYPGYIAEYISIFYDYAKENCKTEEEKSELKSYVAAYRKKIEHILLSEEEQSGLWRPTQRRNKNDMLNLQMKIKRLGAKKAGYLRAKKHALLPDMKEFTHLSLRFIQEYIYAFRDRMLEFCRTKDEKNQVVQYTQDYEVEIYAKINASQAGPSSSSRLFDYQKLISSEIFEEIIDSAPSEGNTDANTDQEIVSPEAFLALFRVDPSSLNIDDSMPDLLLPRPR